MLIDTVAPARLPVVDIASPSALPSSATAEPLPVKLAVAAGRHRRRDCASVSEVVAVLVPLLALPSFTVQLMVRLGQLPKRSVAVVGRSEGDRASAVW